MKNAYIRLNNRKYINLTEKLIIFINKILVKVSIEKLSINKIDDTSIILIPKYKKYYRIIKKRIIKQINKYIVIDKFEKVIFDENVEFLSECLVDGNLEKKLKQYNLLTGKFLMKISILGILDYIFNINRTNTELENVYLFVNEYSKCNIKIIENMCKKFKTVNIITENLKYFKRLENLFYNDGVLITVSNNKRKSARNAKYVINFDFKKENFEKYNINMDSIIINLSEENVLFEKLFRGILINSFDISINEDYLCFFNEIFGDFDQKIYIESIIIDGKYEEVLEFLSKIEYKIINLIGIRGKIEEKEFVNRNS